jgi:hypothetical protein
VNRRLVNYTFLTPGMEVERPNVYAGQNEQLLKGFSNVHQNHLLPLLWPLEDAPNRTAIAGNPILNTNFDPQTHQLAICRVFSHPRRSGV